MTCHFSFGVRLTCALSVGFLAVNSQSLKAESPRSQPLAGIFRYDAPDGDTYFALSIRAKTLTAQTSLKHDHVVMVDTSASQTGEHRKQAMAVVTAFLKALPRGDRVRLFAVDLKTVSLTPGFAAADSETLRKGLTALKRRFPAGATDMSAAIRTAVKAFDGQRPASVLYIGDGMSTGNLIQSLEMKKLVTLLAERKIAVHSYAVGPRKDLHLLGVLAQQTGGFVLFDTADEKLDLPETVGRKLAAASVAPILYPTSMTVEPAVTLLPGKPLPLRTDRETIFLGKGKLAGIVRVTVRGPNQESLNWTITPRQNQKGHTYLRTMFRRAKPSAGMSVSLAGNHLLHAAHEEFNDQISRLVRLGEHAIATRHLKQAEHIGLAIQKIDPANVRAKALLGAVNTLNVRTVALLQKKTDSIKKAETTPKEENALQQEVKIRRIKLQRLQREVSDAIQTARQVAPSNADGAIGLLKQQLDTVIAETQIDPTGRQQLIKRIRTVMAQLRSKKEVNENRTIKSLERQAQQEAQRRLAEQFQLDEEKLQTLIDQVRALIEDGIHGNDDAYEEAEAVARVAVDLLPGNGTATAALFNAEAAGQLNKAFRLRTLRADRFLETLYQVELSHVPFPDEPPIRWPAAEVWQALTERRRKWASVDLRKNSPAEERIQQELKKTVDADFPEDTTLKEAIDHLADDHNITIIFDENFIKDENISLDDTITAFTATGIKLRSTLKIILEPLGLTYIIRNEVMVITTQAEADLHLTTRVYPVGDLVIPIRTPQGGGGGSFGGGGVGGGGGGGGGYGGGGGGGFGGGGGGGIYSVPPAKLPGLKKPRRPTMKKKPVGDPELQGILDRIVGGISTNAGSFRGQAFAQVRDAEAEKGFRLDNKTLEDLKKKR